MSSDDILNRVEALWRSSNAAYRDALLEVGRLLHDFILVYLEENYDRTRKLNDGQGWRDVAVALCASRLNITARRVNHLVMAAMAVQLLSENGDVGNLPWDTIRRMGRLVCRNSLGGRPLRKGETPAIFENWSIKDEFKDTAKTHFQVAVRENWTIKQTRNLMLSLNDGEAKDNAAEYRSEKRRRRTETQEDAFKVLARLAQAASPKDAAELLFDLIRETESPQAIVSHLQQLAKDAPKRARMCG